MSSKLIRFYNFHFLLPRNFGNNDIIVNRVRFQRALYSSLRKQPTFSDATTGFPAKWLLRNERRNSILMTRHYSDLGSASDWLNQISHAARPIRSTTQIWVVTCRQNGISALVSKTLYSGETSGSVAKCRLFSQANFILKSFYKKCGIVSKAISYRHTLEWQFDFTDRLPCTFARWG